MVEIEFLVWPRHPTQCSSVETGHFVSEFVMDLPVERGDRRGKPLRLSHSFPFCGLVGTHIKGGR